MPSKREPGQVLELETFIPYLFNLITSQMNSNLLERMRLHGVTVPRWRVLMVLMNKDGCTLSELIRLTLIPQSALSRVVDQMARDDMVVRRPSKRDSRAVEVHLTPTGKRKYWKIAPAAEEHAARIVDSLSAVERLQLSHLLKRVLASLEVEPFQMPR